jgi:hypothetical protein
VLLVSLCNVEIESPSSLLLVDPTSWAITPLTMTRGVGSTGICRIGDEIFVACQTAEAIVAVLDAGTLRVHGEARLSGARDPHSIVAWNGGLAIASTGTDEVLWYRYHDGALIDRTVLWAHGTERKDTVHINGLTAHRGALVCCAFGSRSLETDLWSEAHDGFVYDIVNERTLLAGLAHPHSVAFLADELVVCESSHRSLRSAARPLVKLDGYTRGVAFLDDERIVIATSIARTTSRSGNRLLNPGAEGLDAGICALHVAGRDGTVRETVSFNQHGREIYDVFRLR